MSLIKQLELENKKGVIVSFVGGGGKTSTMFTLANELKKFGKRALITTTTAIYYPYSTEYDYIYVGEEIQELENKISKTKASSITVWGKKAIHNLTNENILIENLRDKLNGVKVEKIDELKDRKIFDYILVEADGAKKKAIKAPDVHEPVLPHKTDLIVGIIGFDCYNKEINDENVHRVNKFTNITNTQLGEKIDDLSICRLIYSKNGIFKNSLENSERILIINKVLGKEEFEQALLLKEKILLQVEKKRGEKWLKKILVGSVIENVLI